MSESTSDRLAIEGGTPVRDVSVRPWPRWPIFDQTEEQALLKVLHSGDWWYVEGDQGVAFEQEFAAYQNARHGVACTNGTAALEIALRAMEIGCGDEVIVPPYTFVATATAVLTVGAAPVFADIDGDTLNLDPAQAEAAITPRTRAIIVPHIAGRPADMDALLTLARSRGLRLIEDAAQAHSAEWRGVRVGALGDMGTFSFQASKNLNSGEGGMIVSNDAVLADAAWSIMNVGRVRTGAWYEHHLLGGNFRLTEFQAALLRAQFRRLPEQTALRTRNAAALRELLSSLPGIRLPASDPRITTHANHLFPFRFQPGAFGNRSRDEIVKSLNAEGVPCSSGYVALYREPLFARYAQAEGPGCRAARRIDYPGLHLPVCEQVCSDCIWLPQHLLLSAREDMEDIASAIEKIQRHC